jgi:hypothetical protein
MEYLVVAEAGCDNSVFVDALEICIPCFLGMERMLCHFLRERASEKVTAFS